MTEFCYNGSNISAMKGLGERTQFDISGHSGITEFDIEGVYGIYIFVPFFSGVFSLSSLSDYFFMKRNDENKPVSAALSAYCS